MTGGKGGRGQMLTRASACRPPLYRLAQDVSYGAYPSLCSLVSHCYDPEGKIMGQIMVRMDIPPPVVVVGGGGAEEPRRSRSPRCPPRCGGSSTRSSRS